MQGGTVVCIDVLVAECRTTGADADGGGLYADGGCLTMNGGAIRGYRRRAHGEGKAREHIGDPGALRPRQHRDAPVD